MKQLTIKEVDNLEDLDLDEFHLIVKDDEYYFVYTKNYIDNYELRAGDKIHMITDGNKLILTPEKLIK